MLLIWYYVLQVILKYICMSMCVSTCVFWLSHLYNNPNQPVQFSYLLELQFVYGFKGQYLKSFCFQTKPVLFMCLSRLDAGGQCPKVESSGPDSHVYNLNPLLLPIWALILACFFSSSSCPTLALPTARISVLILQQ